MKGKNDMPLLLNLHFFSYTREVGHLFIYWLAVLSLFYIIASFSIDIYLFSLMINKSCLFNTIFNPLSIMTLFSNLTIAFGCWIDMLFIRLLCYCFLNTYNQIDRFLSQFLALFLENAFQLYYKIIEFPPNTLFVHAF